MRMIYFSQKKHADNKYVQRRYQKSSHLLSEQTTTGGLTSLPDKIAFSLGEDKATWHATSFNAASEDIFGLVGLTPSFLLQPAAPQ